MKKSKLFKFKCLLVALIMVTLCATTAFAVPYEYAENVSGHDVKLYAEELLQEIFRNIGAADAKISHVSSEYAENVSRHIDHPGSENCKYSCVLDELEVSAAPSDLSSCSHSERVSGISTVKDGHTYSILSCKNCGIPLLISLEQ